MSSQIENTPSELTEKPIIDQIMSSALEYEFEPTDLELDTLLNMAQGLLPVNEAEEELRFGILSANYCLESKLSYDERHLAMLGILKSLRKKKSDSL